MANNGDPSTPVRLSYKFQRLREKIRRAIESGELAGKLPGERELARRFHANAKTVSKALCDLTTEGLLVRHVGRGTFVARDAAAVPSVSARRFAWIVPALSGSPFPQSVYDQALQIALRSCIELVVRTVSPGIDGTLPENIISPGELNEFDGVVIVGGRPSRELLAGLLRRHLPFVLLNVQHEAVRTNCVACDYAAGAFELTEHLVMLGHRDIRVLIDVDCMPGASAAETGYTCSMRRHGLSPAPAVVTRPAIVDPALFSADTTPGAIICVGPSMARAASDEAARRGVRIPTDLSLAVMTNAGNRLPEQLGLTSYDTDESKLAFWTLELLTKAKPGQAPQFVVVPGRLVDRGSCGAPRTVAAPTRPTDAVI